MTYILMACMPMVLAALGTMLAIVWAHLTVSTTYAPEAYAAWDDVLADVEAHEVDADWLELITLAHEEEDLWDRMMLDYEADTVDAAWMATIDVAHLALDVLYCTMHADVRPRSRAHAPKSEHTGARAPVSKRTQQGASAPVWDTMPRVYADT